jgi:hypothetical protein
VLAIEGDASCRHIACNYGFIDAGVIKLTREEWCVLLTNDSRLSPWMNKSGPEIELLKNVVYAELTPGESEITQSKGSAARLRATVRGEPTR